ncbi:efflux RND transporter periplasmic adaptor subunit [bacterium]|nr:efflux RND transporter periplasmic adaptor subunit [bacterium]
MFLTNKYSFGRKIPGFALLFFSLIICLIACSEPDLIPPLPDSDTVRVERGTFVSGVEDVGVIKATHSASVTTTVDGKIARMAQEGTQVKKGDPVVWLDDQDIRKEIDSEKINLKRNASDLERARESLGETRFNLEQALKEGLANHQFDELNVERFIREVERLKDRFQRHLIPEEEVLSAQSNLDQKRLKANSSGLALERARVEYDSKMKSLKTDLSIAQQEYERSQFRMTDLQKRHKEMVMKAPANGVVVIKKNWRKEQFKVGDRIWTGVKVLEIPDLSEFQVWTQVPEVHLQCISEGQPVTVRIPALASPSLEGSVESISWLAMPRVLSRGTDYTSDDSSEGGQVFEILVKLNTSNDQLKTGMNVSVVFVEEQVDNVLTVPASTTADDGHGSYVFVYNGEKFSFKRVKIGSVNSSDAIIENGLDEGQRIALYNPGRGI